MTTRKQAEANKANAQHSTGPASIEGKKTVSGNRISHGILSTKLLLADECAEDYQNLLDDLQHQLRPVGTLELMLVERIAVSVWRQQRLVKAETASIRINASPAHIAEKVSLGLGLGNYGVDQKDLEDPPDQELLDWCREVVAESNRNLMLSNLQEEAPKVYAQLIEDSRGSDIAEYLDEVGGFYAYLADLVIWCEDKLKKSDLQEQLSELMGAAKDHLSVPWNKVEIFTKYQTALDNQTYKAMKALREAQEWRLKTIDSDSAVA